MSYSETPAETLQRSASDPDWLNSPTDVVANDLKSSGNESRREWDAFCYEEKNGKLFDPVRKKNIVGVDGKDKAQKKINKELEDWFLSHESGIAVRISPSGGIWNYPDEQIEIYRIAYDFPGLQKKLFCSFHQFQANLENPEDIRQAIFPEEDSEDAIFEIIKWVEKVSQREIEINLNNVNLRSEQAYCYATMLKLGEDPMQVFQKMSQTGFLGQNPIGCGSSIQISSDSLSYSGARYLDPKIGESGDGLGPREFKCPACGYINTRPFGGLVHRCQNPSCSKPESVMCG